MHRIYTHPYRAGRDPPQYQKFRISNVDYIFHYHVLADICLTNESGHHVRMHDTFQLTVFCKDVCVGPLPPVSLDPVFDAMATSIAKLWRISERKGREEMKSLNSSLALWMRDEEPLAWQAGMEPWHRLRHHHAGLYTTPPKYCDRNLFLNSSS